MKEAMYYERENSNIRCLLCPRMCVIKEGSSGFCRARVNKGGKLYTKIYEECSSVALDPIEKKPLYHFYPSTSILSLGTIGCNFGCVFCQNWHISQRDAPVERISPERVVEMAKRGNSVGVAYTYSEPLIWYEYVLDTAKLVREAGLKNVLVTNGFICREPLMQLLPYIDAINLDIKASTDSFYKKYCKGKLSPVLDTAKIAKERVMLEVTNLIIPTLNDGEGEIRELVNWIHQNLGADTPLHFSRYFPHYKLSIEPTPISTLLKAKQIAEEKLKYVYIGNVLDEESNTTYCPSCKMELIRRSGYSIVSLNISSSCECKYCGWKINIVL
jgi:pyruvate formate lyase activating enzyme